MSDSMRPVPGGASSAPRHEARLRGQRRTAGGLTPAQARGAAFARTEGRAMPGRGSGEPGKAGRKVSATAALVGSAAALAGAGITAWMLPGSMPLAAAHPGQEDVQSATLTAFGTGVPQVLTQTPNGGLSPASTAFQTVNGPLVHAVGGGNDFTAAGALSVNLLQVPWFNSLFGIDTNTGTGPNVPAFPDSPFANTLTGSSNTSGTSNPGNFTLPAAPTSDLANFFATNFPGVSGLLDIGVPNSFILPKQSGGDIPFTFGGQSSSADSATAPAAFASAAAFNLAPNYIDPAPSLTLRTVDPPLFQNLPAAVAQAQPVSPADAQAVASAVSQSLPDLVAYPDGGISVFPTGTPSTQFLPVGTFINGTMYNAPGNYVGPGGTPIIVQTPGGNVSDKSASATGDASTVVANASSAVTTASDAAGAAAQPTVVASAVPAAPPAAPPGGDPAGGGDPTAQQGGGPTPPPAAPPVATPPATSSTPDVVAYDPSIPIDYGTGGDFG